MRNHWRTATILGVALGAAPMVLATQAGAETVRVTVENVQAPGGFSLTPFSVAFHDGTFDAFDAGSTASAGVETLAELGDVAGLMPERLAADPGSAAQIVTQDANGPPTIDPGEAGLVEFELDPSAGGQRFMSFLSMIVPSNDQFVGNDDPLAFEIFDAAGTFLGDRSIEVTGLFAYDAGTELNDPEDGPAFVLAADGMAGTEEGGAITQGQFPLDPFVGLQTPAGTVTEPLDLLGDLSGTSIARITVEAVAPIPVPAAAPLLLTALGGLAVARRRRRTA